MRKKTLSHKIGSVYTFNKHNTNEWEIAKLFPNNGENKNDDQEKTKFISMLMMAGELMMMNTMQKEKNSKNASFVVGSILWSIGLIQFV